MRRRRNADEVALLLREADRDLAKGLTISDICRKQGISKSWRADIRATGGLAVQGGEGICFR
jgi:hypothetical protein